MKFGYNSNFRILLGNSNFLFKNLINSGEYLRFNTISLRSYYFTTYPKDQTSSTNTFKIPHWLDIPGSDSNFLSDTLSANSQESKNLFDNGYESRELTDKVVVSSEEKGLKIINKPRPLKKIRPFILNELSAFNTSPYKLIKPIKKNPVLSHIWKLRVNSTYRKGLEKRLVVGSSVIRHILTHTEARFDTILTTDKDLIDFVLSNPTFNSRYSRIQLVDRYTLQYCLRGTTHSNIAPDAVADAVIPKPNTHITPK
ncbi:uncharacterized protein TA19050 [Theileria annulata]|uniref:Uncharacterized protein n=1 Tax=Theileria annulata TaxID=5874 RepID=Q4UG90_THEAN|nr:uncharacterized protein TA19050 [Theileria annulata]CAI73899.1 hypothetical protein TA19050 [Theileria annulata]|eukprot:XP_954576.1 hypothetical protein TA19050 [Theileria annulata]